MGSRCSCLCYVRCEEAKKIILFAFNSNFSLSGLSPFGGRDDNDTIANIRKCDIHFPNEIFGSISDEGKDFIQKLLLKNRK